MWAATPPGRSAGPTRTLLPWPTTPSTAARTWWPSSAARTRTASCSSSRACRRPMDIGLDIVEIDRIRGLARRSPRFLSRVFSAEEIAYCRGKRLQWQHFAVRFAAKEAVWKALGREGLGLKDISVSRDERGKP